MKNLLRLTAFCLLASSAVASPALCAQETPRTPLEELWDARTVEHLLNRAGFGARQDEIEAWVAAGPDALLARLFQPNPDFQPYVYLPPAPLPEGADEKVERRRRLQYESRQVRAFVQWWLDEMVGGVDPLRERMTLFWHGFFTSSSTKVKKAQPLIDQNHFLRENALGSYGDLLTGIVRDPAMLFYLDNHANRKGKPNENLARELFELFSMGEGNYTETDVKEAARALTGHGVDKEGRYQYRPRQHDRGPKEILGVSGRHNAKDLVRIILQQDACASWVAGRLIEYFEGAPVAPERRESYAGFLREHEYGLEPFLQRLFRDPAFYRSEILGARILSPVDYSVSSARRLGIEPPPELLYVVCEELGQKLLDPPSVKGWEEGTAWVTTSTLTLRGNFAGMLTGTFDPDGMRDALTRTSAADDMGEGDADEAMDPMVPTKEQMVRARQGGVGRLSSVIARSSWSPPLSLQARIQQRGATTDTEVVAALADELLAIETPKETLLLLVDYLVEARASSDLAQDGPLSERILRRLAHLILSLPEAQLG